MQDLLRKTNPDLIRRVVELWGVAPSKGDVYQNGELDLSVCETFINSIHPFKYMELTEPVSHILGRPTTSISELMEMVFTCREYWQQREHFSHFRNEREFLTPEPPPAHGAPEHLSRSLSPRPVIHQRLDFDSMTVSHDDSEIKTCSDEHRSPPRRNRSLKRRLSS